MPKRELSRPHQITDWLNEWGTKLEEPASMIFIGSAGLLWHVNLMPNMVLDQLPEGWRERTSEACYKQLTVIVPSTADLLVPKLRRGEPRDLLHVAFARQLGLV